MGLFIFLSSHLHDISLNCMSTWQSLSWLWHWQLQVDSSHILKLDFSHNNLSSLLEQAHLRKRRYYQMHVTDSSLLTCTAQDDNPEDCDNDAPEPHSDIHSSDAGSGWSPLLWISQWYQAHCVSCHFAHLLAPLNLSMTRAWVVTISVEVGWHESSGCEQQPPHLWTRVQDGITISLGWMSATSTWTMVGSGIQAAGLASSLSPDNNVWNGDPALMSDEELPGIPYSTTLLTSCFRYIFRIDSMYLR